MMGGPIGVHLVAVKALVYRKHYFLMFIRPFRGLSIPIMGTLSSHKRASPV